ncbi:hypothetical protein D9M68_770230 [compost metagenome]
MGQLDRVRRLAFPIQLHFDEVIDEHREIYAAIREGDETRAESLMGLHMDGIFESLERLVREQRGFFIEGLTNDELKSVRQLSSRIR